VLRLSNGYSSLEYVPAVAYFVNRVGELSDGALQIEVVHDRGKNSDPGFEQDIVRDVEAGNADLAWVGTRVFDTFGVTSFQALTAPMLIESYPLLQAVLDSDMPAQMLKGLDGLGVTGLGVLADSLRKPLAVDRPLLGPADWQGITFAVIRSNGQAAAIRALGATPTDAWGSPWLDKGLGSGEIQGVEKGLFAIRRYGSLVGVAPYLTANVNLWPQAIALVANPARLSQLTDDQRGWLEQAAGEASAHSTGLVANESQIVADLCVGGARFVTASEAELAGLRQSFAPLYAELEQDPQTKTFIDRIQQLKEATPPGPALSIPPSCTGLVLHGTAADPLAGTWQTEMVSGPDWIHAFIRAGGTEHDAHTSWASESEASWSLRFEDGYFTFFDENGVTGYGPDPYEIAPDGTLTIRDPTCVGTYIFTVTADTLRLMVEKQCERNDAPYNTAFFASFPLTKSG
jgi:TRAP-type C4-dicarboxylate transport system substrate-binding protein